MAGMNGSNAGHSRISRRDFLRVAAVGGGVGLGAGLAASPAAATNKMSPRAMSYRPTPNGSQRCDNCANWQPPASCKLVDGQIAPTGWCILYNAKR
ncbi:MAG: twin-arginine translocation signal domain-containing protein [Sphingomicrobium sp.]